jgi:hypothetical protein
LQALRQTVGNQGVQRLLRAGAIRAKLRVGQPNDAREQEADRVADRVMSAPEALPDREHAKRTGSSDPGQTAAPPSVGEVLRSPGQPLDPATRAFMEPRFGADLGAVRVHADAEADRSARAIDALAYTAGDHIAFRAGRYDPSSLEGKRLLAHELTHAVHHAAPTTVLCKRPIPDVDTAETFTQVSTTKLDENGRFTGPLLDFISSAWTQKAVGHPAEIAQQIVDALEQSAEFVAMAKNLDAYLLKHPDLEIVAAASSTGTKFVPANTPYQSSPEGPVQIPGLTAPADSHTIFIDFYKSEIAFYSGATGPQQIAIFVRNLIHETAHVFNLVNRITTTGLTGALEEEQRTRKTELKGLEEIRRATKNPDLGKELSTRIAEAKAGPLTLAAIAEDLTQEGTETYLESYYLGQAVNSLTSKRDAAREKVERAGLTGFGGLAPIEELSDFDFMIYNLNATFLINANARGFSAERDKSGVKLPITNAHRLMLLKLLDPSLTLKQVTDVADTGLNDAEKLMLYHVQLIQAYRVKTLVAREWAAFAKNPSPPASSAVADDNAKKYLGRPGAYAALRKARAR